MEVLVIYNKHQPININIYVSYLIGDLSNHLSPFTHIPKLNFLDRNNSRWDLPSSYDELSRGCPPDEEKPLNWLFQKKKKSFPAFIWNINTSALNCPYACTDLSNNLIATSWFSKQPWYTTPNPPFPRILVKLSVLCSISVYLSSRFITKPAGFSYGGFVVFKARV